jgi:hypothetical protein
MPEAQRDGTASMWARWRWFVYALLSLGGLGGGWRAKQLLTRKSPPVADLSKPQGDPLGLGADGTGGVWLREAPPWWLREAPPWER